MTFRLRTCLAKRKQERFHGTISCGLSSHFTACFFALSYTVCVRPPISYCTLYFTACILALSYTVCVRPLISLLRFVFELREKSQSLWLIQVMFRIVVLFQYCFAKFYDYKNTICSLNISCSFHTNDGLTMRPNHFFFKFSNCACS